MMNYLSLVCAVSISAPLVFAKPIVNTIDAPVGGKLTTGALEQIKDAARTGKASLSQSEYEDVVADPQKARTDGQKVAALSAREMIIMVDKSGSMNRSDDNPTGGASANWTRWDSARIAAESLSELMLNLDKSGAVDVVFWEGQPGTGELVYEAAEMRSCEDITKMFTTKKPQRGSTPLYLALERVYEKKLHNLLQKGEPFTVVILTDGEPDPGQAQQTKQFFKKVIRDNDLESKGRETLAAFSFVRMGDDPTAAQFLKDLDDNLIKELDVKVDIVDTEEDNFLFGTGKYKGKDGVGPFALLWNVLFNS